LIPGSLSSFDAEGVDMFNARKSTGVQEDSDEALGFWTLKIAKARRARRGSWVATQALGAGFGAWWVAVLTRRCKPVLAFRDAAIDHLTREGRRMLQEDDPKEPNGISSRQRAALMAWLSAGPRGPETFWDKRDPMALAARRASAAASWALFWSVVAKAIQKDWALRKRGAALGHAQSAGERWTQACARCDQVASGSARLMLELEEGGMLGMERDGVGAKARWLPWIEALAAAVDPASLIQPSSPMARMQAMCFGARDTGWDWPSYSRAAHVWAVANVLAMFRRGSEQPWGSQAPWGWEEAWLGEARRLGLDAQKGAGEERVAKAPLPDLPDRRRLALSSLSLMDEGLGHPQWSRTIQDERAKLLSAFEREALQDVAAPIEAVAAQPGGQGLQASGRAKVARL
jgi:hypothetical protein